MPGATGLPAVPQPLPIEHDYEQLAARSATPGLVQVKLPIFQTRVWFLTIKLPGKKIFWCKIPFFCNQMFFSSIPGLRLFKSWHFLPKSFNFLQILSFLGLQKNVFVFYVAIKLHVLKWLRTSSTIPISLEYFLKDCPGREAKLGCFGFLLIFSHKQRFRPLGYCASPFFL